MPRSSATVTNVLLAHVSPSAEWCQAVVDALGRAGVEIEADGIGLRGNPAAKMLSPEVRKAYLVARDLFAEPGVADRADALTAEACRIAVKQMATIAALRFFAARGNKEAQGFLAALRVSLRQAVAQ
jgi:hypothetical protein